MVETSLAGSNLEYVYAPGAGLNPVANAVGQTLGAAVIPLPGGAQAVYLSTGLAYRHSDWLGSARLTSTSTQAVFASGALAPYGEVYDWTGTSAYESFTGEQQDTASGVYDFPARRLSASMGRWLSPDPLGVGAVNPANPQSWNRYAYVLNNPVALTDPTGLSTTGYKLRSMLRRLTRTVDAPLTGCRFLVATRQKLYLGLLHAGGGGGWGGGILACPLNICLFTQYDVQWIVRRTSGSRARTAAGLGSTVTMERSLTTPAPVKLVCSASIRDIPTNCWRASASEGLSLAEIVPR